MKVYRSFNQIEHSKNHIVTVGTFDGVHLGHQKILQKLKEYASKYGGESLIITFDPHPQIVLKKENREPIKLLTTIEERLQLFAKMEIDKVLVAPFTKEFSQTTAQDFIEKYLVGKVGLHLILLGHDHLFGKNREGNFELINELARKLGFEAERVPAYILEEIVVSSTKIRNALLANKIELANKLLGYDYFIHGKVVQGDGRGAKLGFPTANIKFDDANKLVPSNGVFLVYSEFAGRKYYGMANIGIRPTFYTDYPKTLEVYYFDLNQNLYGINLSVHFLKFIRYEQKFDSIDGLLRQLDHDKETCLEIINQSQFYNKKIS